MSKVIFGLCGKLAAGKDTIGAYLKEKYNADTLSFSDSLREALEIYDLPISRDNLQKISALLRESFSQDILARAMGKKIRVSDKKLIAITNVRRQSDVENLKDEPGFMLVYIDADQKKRYGRYVARGQYSGDQEMSFEEFCVKDGAEAESQIEGLREKAKFVIDNNSSVEDLHKQIEEVFHKINAN